MLTLVFILLLAYLGLGVAAYYLSEKIIFQPQPLKVDDKTIYIRLDTPEKKAITAKFFKNPGAEFTILFSHGNAEDISGSSWFYQNLSNAGFNVFVYDYRGYGKSEGTPSEKNSYEDIETAYNYLIKENQIAPEKIIIHGRSLGGAVSIDLASRKECGGLIVESTFTSAFRVLTRYRIYPFDKFNSLGKIKKIKCPVLFIHGREDEIIPFWHSETLFAEANEPKYFFPVEAANHNDVSEIGGENYFQTIKDFAGKLSK